jgi:hypothetical protein
MKYHFFDTTVDNVYSVSFIQDWAIRGLNYKD